MSSEMKLVPCPFCGSTNLKQNVEAPPSLYCISCFAEGPVADTEARAVEAWNTRFPSASPTAPGAEGNRIAEAVLNWMIRYDLLDGGNEYYAADVLAVLDDLAPASDTPTAEEIARRARELEAVLVELLAHDHAEDCQECAIGQSAVWKRARALAKPPGETGAGS